MRRTVIVEVLLGCGRDASDADGGALPVCHEQVERTEGWDHAIGRDVGRAGDEADGGFDELLDHAVGSGHVACEWDAGQEHGAHADSEEAARVDASWERRIESVC